jgi:hypothetical protein
MNPPAYKPLAVVIPAYKCEFLREALESLAAQTCLDFTVYLGDDASPHDLGSIVEEFRERLDVRYHRFEDNRGAVDLVAQWSRCVDLSGDEPLLWLFSDDDVAEARCVEELLGMADLEPEVDVFRFDIQIVDREGRPTRPCRPFPPHLSAGDFLAGLFRGRLDARMPEFVFRKDAFVRRGGFERFDLAFRTDTATVAKFAARGGISTVPGPRVHWRESGGNVSCRPEPDQVLRRVRATVDFFDWLEGFLVEERIPCRLGALERLRVVLENASPLVATHGLGVAAAEANRSRILLRNPWLRPASRGFLLFQSTFYPRHRGL